MSQLFFNIEMLPAHHGDCLWIEYGDDTRTNRILIDGGPVTTFGAIAERIAQVPAGEKGLELVILTHVDADHVEGLVRLFAETSPLIRVRRVWFNGWRQMKKSHKLLGATQGEFLSALLVDRLPKAWDVDAPPWFVPAKGKLPVFKLPGGMRLTLLSPSAAKLKAMAEEWAVKVKEDKIAPGDLAAAWNLLAQRKKFLPNKRLLGTTPILDKLLQTQFQIDPKKANGSSIAVLAEWGQGENTKSALLLGDAHPDVVASSIKRLCTERDIHRLKVDAVKVAHHGSKKNTDVALLKLIDSPTYLISTNGAQFRHPDQECLARILKVGRPRSICFNYKTDYTKPWITKAAQTKYGYVAKVRSANELSIKVEL